jgi:hypothetical protein
LAPGPSHYNAASHSSNFLLKMCLPYLVRLGTPTCVGVPKQPPSSGAAAVPYAIGLQQARARHHIHDFRHLLTLLAEQGRPNREGHGSGSHLEDPRCSTVAAQMLRGCSGACSHTLRFTCKTPSFPKWAMLGSNERPPPCTGGNGCCRALQAIAKPAYLSRFLF